MNYFTMKFILIISVFLDFGMSAKQSTLSLDGQQSFVRRGIGFQYLSELGTGSSGNHKLIFFLSVEKLKNTALLLKVQVGDMLSILREKGLNFENVNLDKDVETLKGIIASRTNGHHNLLNNANLIIDQFQELLEIKKKILISELDLISNIIEEFEFNIINPSKKRAILPIVGQIGEVLFGLSSTSTVEKLSDKLEELSNDQEKVTKFISVSASVISELEISLNKLRNETLDQVSQSFKTFESELSDNALKITSSLVVNFAQIHNAVEKLTSNILNKLQSFRFHLEQLSKGLIQVLNGNFPVSVISPVKLISYLKFVQQSLPKGFELAIDDFRSGLIIETLKHVECSLEFDLINVLFVCDFPLSKILDSFQLYKTFEAPVAIRDSFTASGKQIYSVITNGEPYIGIGGDESSYIILDEGFMSSCFYVKSKIVCKRRFVIHKFPSSNSCAFSVFFNKTDLENLVCKRNLKTLDSLFIHSLSDSQFYFAGGGANNPISIRCLKGNQYNKTFSYRLNINNSLIVNIPDECSVTSEYFRINEEFFSYNLYNMSANLPNLTMDFHSVIFEILGHSSDLVKTFIDFENSVVPNFKWKEGISSFSIPISELNELSRDISNKTREKKIVATGISIMTLVIIALFTFVGFLSWRLKQIWYKLLAVRASNLPLN